MGNTLLVQRLFLITVFLFYLPVSGSESAVLIPKQEVNNSWPRVIVSKKYGQEFFRLVNEENFKYLAIKVPVGIIPKTKTQVIPFLESRVVKEILYDHYKIIDWIIVDDDVLRRKIWELFVKTHKINYHIKGLVLKNVRHHKGDVIVVYDFNEIFLSRNYAEKYILEVIGIDEDDLN